MKHWAVLVAAGEGRRMDSDIPKQYLPLAGRTVLEHSLQPFLEHPQIDGVAVVLAAQDRLWPTLARQSGKPVITAVGGAERADSVLAGLQAIHHELADDDWVLVHDAARACLRLADLDYLLNELADDICGGLLAVPARDTLKQAEQGRAMRTLDRNQVWQAQTPQMFRYGMLRASLARVGEEGLSCTDEAMAMELAGYAPRLVEGPASNIKITTSHDLPMAEFILRQQQQQE